MIVRVDIENLVLVARATVEPGPGLTSVTGETGAGKTLFATAIGLLFGAPADGGQVGAAGDHAWVEGEFDPPAWFWSDPSVEAIAGLRPEDDAPLVLARRIGSNGRSRAMAWGRTISRSDLEAAGRLLVATAGQHAGRRLVSPAWQRTMVDRCGGADVVTLLADMRAAWTALLTAETARQQVRAQVEEAARFADSIRDDHDRIAAVAPSVEEEQDLLQQRSRARNHARLFDAFAGSLQAIAADELSATDSVGRAGALLQDVADVDGRADEISRRLLGLQAELIDVAGELRQLVDELSGSPAAIDDIEERLGAYDELHRRFGGTTEAVLIRLEELQQQVDAIEDADGVLAAADERCTAARRACEEIAAELTSARGAVATRLADDVRALLADLGMGHSVFRIDVVPGELGAHGADVIELRLAPDAALEPRPISQVASGGELSRLALALHVASGEGEAPTMIFDEIDAGIGGHTAHAIASLLSRMAVTSQVICISHLPQVAARADAHVVIERDADGTMLRRLDSEDAVPDELCRMLGAAADDDAARDHARQLRGTRAVTDEPAGGTQLLLDGTGGSTGRVD